MCACCFFFEEGYFLFETSQRGKASGCLARDEFLVIFKGDHILINMYIFAVGHCITLLYVVCVGYRWFSVSRHSK